MQNIIDFKKKELSDPEVSILRKEYLESLPLFQELFLEIQVGDSSIFTVEQNSISIGHIIINSEKIALEFYLQAEYLNQSKSILKSCIQNFDLEGFYCKSFDFALLDACLSNKLSYEVIGTLYRDYNDTSKKHTHSLDRKRFECTDIEILLNQDESINELFDNESQLRHFILNEHVFGYYQSEDLIGCGIIIKTHKDYNYCDLGVWVNPQHRKQGFASYILNNLRDIALSFDMIPSCGCAIDNIASGKAIEKSGFISKHTMLFFGV